MHQKIIDNVTSGFRELVEALPSEALFWKPNSTSWSIAENMQHLILINQSYYPGIQALLRGNQQLPFTSRIEFLVDYMGKSLLQAVQPDRKKKTKTFSIWKPQIVENKPDLLSCFQRHQEQFKHLIKNCQTQVQKGAIISSPANKYIVYRLETAFEILVAHEQRHLEQARKRRDLYLNHGNT